MKRSRQSEDRVSLPDLTLKQRQVLGLLQSGKSWKQISAEMGIGRSGVRRYKELLCKKFEVKNSYSLISVSSVMMNDPDAQKASA